MKSRNISKLSFLVATTALMSVSATYSAVAQAVPSTARPEAVQRQFEIQERPEVGGAPVVVSPRANVDGIEGEASFTFKGINYRDLGVYEEADLLPIYEDKIGTTITVNELNAIVAEITAFYRNNGYILSRAVLPPQSIDSGTVQVRIIEGYINEVRLQGEVGSESSPLRKYADKIKASKPLNTEKLERYLLLMEDLPGVEARAVLTPAAEATGASDVVITVSRKKYEADVTVDNRGSRFLGPVQAGLRAAGNNLLGMDEQTQVRVIGSILEIEELKFGELRHEQQLGGEGLKLVVSAGHVDTKPGSILDGQMIEGTTTTFTVGVEYPILRSRQSNWFVGADFSSQKTDINQGGANQSEDDLRILSVNTSYDFLDKYAAVNNIDFEVSQGLNLGTGQDGGLGRSRLGGETNFTKFSFNASRLQTITGPWSAFVAATGQYSMDSLLASEEFVVGGQQFGSAYDAAEITGDSGVAARAELQYSASPEWRMLSQYQLYGFYDAGKVYNRDIVANSELTNVSIASTGLGARLNITDSISGNFEAAIPLTKTVSAFGQDGSAPRAFFGLQYRY